jgi:hypothetical protein
MRGAHVGAHGNDEVSLGRLRPEIGLIHAGAARQRSAGVLLPADDRLAIRRRQPGESREVEPEPSDDADRAALRRAVRDPHVLVEVGPVRNDDSVVEAERIAGDGPGSGRSEHVLGVPKGGQRCGPGGGEALRQRFEKRADVDGVAAVCHNEEVAPDSSGVDALVAREEREVGGTDAPGLEDCHHAWSQADRHGQISGAIWIGRAITSR